MAVRCYVLVETAVGKARYVGGNLGNLTPDGGRILSVETVTGPYDVIACLEADDLDLLGTFITERIQQIDGVQRTTTCLSIRLS